MKTATPAQADLIRRMMRSHVITDDERAGIERRLEQGFTEGTPADAIEWLMAEIKERKKAEKEAATLNLPL